MTEAQLFFLSDQYYIDFPDDKLMKNKDVIAGKPHNRPCFFAFRDLKNSEILWLVPISSKYKKYKKIEQEKIQKYGSCFTIRFGKVLDRDAAFLIQNMCPTTEKYLTPYIDKNNNPIRIDNRIADDVIKSAKNVLAMANRGAKVIFPDLFKIFRSLERQNNKESQKSNPDCNQKKPSVLDELKQIREAQQSTSASEPEAKDRDTRWKLIR